MSVAVDNRLRLSSATNSFRIRKNDLVMLSDDEAGHSDGTEKTENGTQTKVSRSKGNELLNYKGIRCFLDPPSNEKTS